MAPNEIDTKAHDAMRRKRGAGVVAAIVFMVIFAVFVFRFEPWGLALGWLPAATAAAACGRIAYCFPWVVDILAILLDLIVACIGQHRRAVRQLSFARDLVSASHDIGAC